MRWKFWTKKPDSASDFVDGPTRHPSRPQAPHRLTRHRRATQHQRSGGFYGLDTNRLLAGWTTESAGIDHYLCQDLRALRARSRELCRQDEYGKNFLRVMRRNIIGAAGIRVQSVVTDPAGEADMDTRDALEKAWADWSSEHCDWSGERNLLQIQNLLITTTAQDGEFLVCLHTGAQAGKYGLQLEIIDPARLDDRERFGFSGVGGGIETRLGVERDPRQRPIGYWIRERERHYSYDAGRLIRYPASRILHGFISEHPDQSRGIPWLHSSIRTGKRLDMYEDAAMSAAQTGAMAAFALTNRDALVGDDRYTGDTADDAGTTMHLDSGEVVDLGDKQITSLDPDYPHEMYSDFTKNNLRRFAAGLGLSYSTISADLEGVNYSSIRAGVLEDREEYQTLQQWFIDDFMIPVYTRFVEYAILSGQFQMHGETPMRPPMDYFPADFQGRRWSWVDPQKDMNSGKTGIALSVRSRSSIIREAGQDPDTVFAEIAQEQKKMKDLGINVDLPAKKDKNKSMPPSKKPEPE